MAELSPGQLGPLQSHPGCNGLLEHHEIGQMHLGKVYWPTCIFTRSSAHTSQSPSFEYSKHKPQGRKSTNTKTKHLPSPVLTLGCRKALQTCQIFAALVMTLLGAEPTRKDCGRKDCGRANKILVGFHAGRRVLYYFNVVLCSANIFVDIFLNIFAVHSQLESVCVKNLWGSIETRIFS